MDTIQIHNLSKSYNNGTIRALKDINLTVHQGELFGLIGPDGAGKTTLFRILTTLLLADNGQATVNGCNVVTDYKQIRQQVGYMPGKFSLYQDLSVEENLKFFATLFNTTVEQNMGLVKDIYVQLEPFKDRKAGKLSGGMKQKLALCCALIHRPTVLFLDEPTTGVDTVSRKEFWHMLKRLKQEGITILVSTPYMDEATLCERIALIQNGEILSVNTPAGIIHQYPETLYAVKADNMPLLMKTLGSIPEVSSCNSFGDYHHITLQKTTAQQLLTQLRSKEFQELELKEIEPTVEDCFIDLMHKQ